MVLPVGPGARRPTASVPGPDGAPGRPGGQVGAATLRRAAGADYPAGYRAGRIESLGSINPNPALFANRVHMLVALDCDRIAYVGDHAHVMAVAGIGATRPMGEHT